MLALKGPDRLVLAKWPTDGSNYGLQVERRMKNEKLWVILKWHLVKTGLGCDLGASQGKYTGGIHQRSLSRTGAHCLRDSPVSGSDCASEPGLESRWGADC